MARFTNCLATDLNVVSGTASGLLPPSGHSPAASQATRGPARPIRVGRIGAARLSLEVDRQVAGVAPLTRSGSFEWCLIVLVVGRQTSLTFYIKNTRYKTSY